MITTIEVGDVNPGDTRELGDDVLVVAENTQERVVKATTKDDVPVEVTVSVSYAVLIDTRLSALDVPAATDTAVIAVGSAAQLAKNRVHIG